MFFILTILSGLLPIIGSFPYIRDVVNGLTHPPKATWLIWAGLDVMVFIGMYLAGTVSAQIIGVALGSLIIAILSLWYGKPGWERRDKFCLVGAGMSMVALKMFDPRIGLGLTLAVILLGSIPIFAETWKNPANENRLAWIIWSVSGICAVLLIPAWTFANAATPVAFLGIQTVMMYILYFRLHS